MRSTICLSLLLFFVLNLPGFCNWQPSKGSYGGIIQSLAQSENVIIAGCYGNESGLFVSENGGSTWIKVIKNDTPSNMTPDVMVHNIVQKDNENIFYIATQEGIYKLFKGTNEWEIISIGFQFTQIPITDIAYYNGDIFVSFWEQGIRKSSNEGMNWNTVNEGLTDLNVASLNHAGDTIFAGTEHGLYYTSDLGNNWSFFDEGLRNSYINELPRGRAHEVSKQR